MLRKKRFQNKVAASRYALPITATLATLVWVAVGLLVSNIWVQFAFTILSTFLMVELNNRNALMRTYSRMVSCSFLVLITIASLPHPSLRANIVTLCFIAFYSSSGTLTRSVRLRGGPSMPSSASVSPPPSLSRYSTSCRCSG